MVPLRQRSSYNMLSLEQRRLSKIIIPGSCCLPAIGERRVALNNSVRWLGLTPLLVTRGHPMPFRSRSCVHSSFTENELVYLRRLDLSACLRVCQGKTVRLSPSLQRHGRALGSETIHLAARCDAGRVSMSPLLATNSLHGTIRRAKRHFGREPGDHDELETLAWICCLGTN